MQYFPFRRTHQEADESLGKIIETAKANDHGWAVACLKETGEPIGFTGLSNVNFECKFTPATEIGWRYVARHWGNGYATEAAKALITHGFEDLKLDRIVSFAIFANSASIAIMKRLGMRPDPSQDFDMPGVGDEYAHLRRHVFYELTNEEEISCNR